MAATHRPLSHSRGQHCWTWQITALECLECLSQSDDCGVPSWNIYSNFLTIKCHLLTSPEIFPRSKVTHSGREADGDRAIIASRICDPQILASRPLMKPRLDFGVAYVHRWGDFSYLKKCSEGVARGRRVMKEVARTRE